MNQALIDGRPTVLSERPVGKARMRNVHRLRRFLALLASVAVERDGHLAVVPVSHFGELRLSVATCTISRIFK